MGLLTRPSGCVFFQENTCVLVHVCILVLQEHLGGGDGPPLRGSGTAGVARLGRGWILRKMLIGSRKSDQIHGGKLQKRGGEMICHSGKPCSTMGNHFPRWEIIFRGGISCSPNLQTPIHRDIHDLRPSFVRRPEATSLWMGVWRLGKEEMAP